MKTSFKTLALATLAAFMFAACSKDGGGGDEPDVTIDDSGYWQDGLRQKELHGNLKSVTETRNGNPHNYMEFDAQKNLLKDESFAYQYDDKHRIVKIFYDGEETTQIAHDGRHNVYIPSNTTLSYDLRLQQGISSISYNYEDDDMSGKLNFQSANGNKLTFSIQMGSLNISVEVEKNGVFPTKITVNPQLATLPYVGAKTLVYSMEYDAGGMFKKMTFSSPQITELGICEFTSIAGFMNLTSLYNLENGVKKSETKYTYNDSGHVLTESERKSSGTVYEYRYTYEYDSRKNWTKRVEEEKQTDGSWRVSETLNREITYW
jgi:hypothetical protein